MATLFFNAQILTMTQQSPSLLCGAVGVVDSCIALITESAEDIAQFIAQHPDLHRVDCQGKLLMPGLINTHAHNPMTLQRGSGDDTELMAWLNNIVWPFERQQSPEDVEAGARMAIAEMLLGGTTTFVDMYWPEVMVANAAEQMGIRALLGENIFEGDVEQIEARIAPLVERVAECDRINAAVAPHAPYTCSPETLVNCVAVAQKYNLPIMIHLAETLDEENIIRERYDRTPTEHLDHCGVLTERTILAHGIYLNESDMELIKNRGSHISHNPQSNMKLSSGVAPIPTLMDQGITCSLGTDGVCSNNDLDMWDEMRTASFLHKLTSHEATTLPAYRVLQMVTTEGAKAIGRAGELGVIAEGALADIIVVNTSRIHYRPHYDLISSLVYCGKAADVEMVMVDGELLVENYALKNHDVEHICRDVEQRSSKIFESLGRS